MRLPWRKLYRAFAELDGFSDAECQDMIRRVMNRSLWRTLVVSGIALCACMAVVGVCLLATVILSRGVSRAWELEFIGVGLAIGCGGGVIAALFVRDLYLRTTIQKWILSSRCDQCTYSLLGLHAQDGRITCPECGHSNDVVARGLDPTTLVPRIVT